MLNPLIHDLNPSQAGLPKLIERGGSHAFVCRFHAFAPDPIRVQSCV